MAIQNDNTLVTKGDLKALYSDKIAPYLGANLALGTNYSTYYSPDEKIIGVWSNAAGTSLLPLYQKTFYFTTPSTQGSYNVGTIATGAEPKHIFGGIKWGTGSFIELNYIDQQASTSSFCYSENTVLKVVIKDSDLLSKTAFLTVQYTKNTDTANSAVTTPGCYDINFPNTWPENKEIYFGNGLYGQRFTGKITVASETWITTQLVPAGSPALHIVSNGGKWVYSNDGSEIPLNSNWNYQINFNNGIDNMTPKGGAMNFGSVSSTARTNAPYDIWITYTK